MSNLILNPTHPPHNWSTQFFLSSFLLKVRIESTEQSMCVSVSEKEKEKEKERERERERELRKERKTSPASFFHFCYKRTSRHNGWEVEFLNEHLETNSRVDCHRKTRHTKSSSSSGSSSSFYKYVYRSKGR